VSKSASFRTVLSFNRYRIASVATGFLTLLLLFIVSYCQR